MALRVYNNSVSKDVFLRLVEEEGDIILRALDSEGHGIPSGNILVIKPRRDGRYVIHRLGGVNPDIGFSMESFEKGVEFI